MSEPITTGSLWDISRTGKSQQMTPFKNFYKTVYWQLFRIIRKIKKVFFYSEKKINQVKRLRIDRNYDLAEKAINQILQKKPNNYYAQAEYAQLAHEMEKFEIAAKLWEQLLANQHLNSTEKDKYKLMAAESYLAAGKKEKVISLLSYVQNDIPDANLGLANCYLDKKQNWMKEVNQFLTEFSLHEIEIDQSADSFYKSLANKPKQSIDNKPKVSVIMSAFNAENLLLFAAYSILNQSWKNLELIIVNDASSDHTLEIAERIAAQDTRVKVINNKVNVGTYVCRNLGLKISTGDFVTTHDSDDWAHPDRIRIQVENLVKNNHIANLTKSVRVYEDGRFELTSWGTYLSDRCCVSLMINKKQAFPIFGYWDSIRVSGDVEYIDRIYAVMGKKSIEVLPQPLVFQLRHGNSLTTAPLTMGVAGRVSPAREIYKQNYQNWHKKIDKNTCRIPFPMDQRPFSAPIEMIDPPPKSSF